MKRYLDPSGPHAQGVPAVAAVRRYLAAVDGRAVWAVADEGEGRRSHARRHGDFDDDPATVESLRVMLEKGC
jgi:hypothetical protein